MIKDVAELARRVRWYVSIRWFFLISLGLSGLVPEYFAHSPSFGGDVLILAAGLAYNGLFWLLTRPKANSRYFKVLGLAQIASDLAIIGYLIFSHGGIESRSIVVFAIPILLAGALFDQVGTYATAIASALLYDLILLADWTRLLPSLADTYPSWHTDGGYLVTSIIFYSSSLLIIAIISDYLLRLLRRREQELATQADALESAQSIAQIGSWELDISTNTVSWTRELGNIYGLPEQPLKAKREAFIKFVHPDDRQILHQTIEKAIKDGQPFTLERRIIRPDGAERTLKVQGAAAANQHHRPVKLFGTVQDVTERAGVEQSLKLRGQDLEKLNQLMIGRELKMIELKRELETLKDRLGEETKS